MTSRQKTLLKSGAELNRKLNLESDGPVSLGYAPKRVRLTRLVVLGLVVGSLGACSDFQRAIGSKKSSPDEFSVVVRPPLSLPPGFADSPDEIRSNEETAALDARARAGQVLGSTDIKALGYDALFDFASIPENIREKVDEETYGIRFERRLPMEVVFGGIPNMGPVLDKIAEDKRLRKNRLEGLLPTDGEILAIDEISDEPVIIKP
jgi:hypothetical protein